MELIKAAAQDGGKRTQFKQSRPALAVEHMAEKAVFNVPESHASGLDRQASVLRRQRVAKLVLLASSLCMTFASMELALRLLGCQPRTATVLSTYFEYDPATGWAGRSDAAARFVTSSFDVEITHGPDGFRSSAVDGERTTDAGDKVVWCLGDSCVWGWGVADGQTFVDVLNRHPDDEQVFRNLGITGFGTLQEYLLLEQLLANESPPDQVLVTFCENDLADNLDTSGRPHLVRDNDAFEIVPARPPSTARLITTWFKRNSLACNYLTFYAASAKNALFTRRDKSWRQRENQVAAVAGPAATSARESLQWQALDHCYGLLQDLCRRHGIELAIVWQFEDPLAPGLAEIAERRSLRVIDLSSELHRQREISNFAGSLQFEWDPHYHSKGHEMVGQALADHLEAPEIASRQSTRR